MKPILFNTAMVKAIIRGDKTQTRRIIRPHYRADEFGFMVITNVGTGEKYIEKYDDDECTFDVPRYVNPPYAQDDILYVREAWHKDVGRYMYRADYSDSEKFYANGREIVMKWRPSIHMPKEAARLFLRVLNVRIERLQDIDEDGVCAEGGERIISQCEHMDYSVTPPEPCYNTRQCKDCVINYSYPELFGKMIWDTTIEPDDLEIYGWKANPWVWVIEFERIDRLPEEEQKWGD